MNELRDKVIIVTGAGKGIGKGIAELLSDQGAQVIVATKDEVEGKLVEDQLKKAGGNATFIQTDVSNEDSVRNLTNQVVALFGHIDVLVNNAGITIFKSILDASVEDWNLVINTDLKGVFLCSKYVAAKMVETKTSGSIINISSNHAYRTLPDTEMYAAAKGGVNAMGRSMALSLGKYGIRVNTVCPGFTDTNHYRHWLNDKDQPDVLEQEINQLHALGKISTPLDIAHLVSFLASDRSGNMTGGDYLIDGGLTSRLYHSEKF